MYLTAAETRERLRISRETLRKLINSGELKASKIGNGPTSDLRISEEAIADYMERHTVTPTVQS
jgi:excisionase family DNA binding protein